MFQVSAEQMSRFQRSRPTDLDDRNAYDGQGRRCARADRVPTGPAMALRAYSMAARIFVLVIPAPRRSTTDGLEPTRCQGGANLKSQGNV